MHGCTKSPETLREGESIAPCIAAAAACTCGAAARASSCLKPSTRRAYSMREGHQKPRPVHLHPSTPVSPHPLTHLRRISMFLMVRVTPPCTRMSPGKRATSKRTRTLRSPAATPAAPAVGTCNGGGAIKAGPTAVDVTLNTCGQHSTPAQSPLNTTTEGVGGRAGGRGRNRAASGSPLRNLEPHKQQACKACTTRCAP